MGERFWCSEDLFCLCSLPASVSIPGDGGVETHLVQPFLAIFPSPMWVAGGGASLGTISSVERESLL